MLVLLLLRSALANSIFPGEIYNHLGLEVAPQCTLCHVDNLGGLGTIDKPFGEWMYDHDLRGDSTLADLDALLDQMESDGVDSDGDGVGDIQELRDGTDPNVSGATLEPPQYGCLATASGVVPSALLALVALGLVRRRR
jgi:hypothetical protein